MSRVDESVPLLTAELLSEYEGRLKDLGVQVEDGFAPGLGEAEMAAVGCYLVSLERAVADHAENRALAEEREPGNPDH